MAEVEGGRGEEILDFGFWILDEESGRNAEAERGRLQRERNADVGRQVFRLPLARWAVG